MKIESRNLLFGLIFLGLSATGYSYSLTNAFSSISHKTKHDRHKRAVTAASIERQITEAETGISDIIRSSKQRRNGESLYISLVIDNSYQVSADDLNTIKSILYESLLDHHNDLVSGKIQVNILGYSDQSESFIYLHFGYKLSPTRYPGSGYIKFILDKRIVYENDPGQDGISAMYNASNTLRNQNGRKMIILASTGHFTDRRYYNLDSVAENFKTSQGIEIVSLAVGSNFFNPGLNAFSSGADHVFKVNTREDSPRTLLSNLVRG